MQRLIPLFVLLAGCATGPRPVAFRPISGFSPATNQAIADLLARSKSEPGRKVAVFDGDGTVFGQVPHYLADECLYQDAQKKNRQPAVVEHMRPLSNVSHPYVVDRVWYFEGATLEEQRALGEECYRRDYPGKIYPPMRDLVAELMRHGFEVWIITASPEAMYQGFLSRALGVPITNVVGVKSVVSHGRGTRTIVEPVPQDEGKMQAIETFVQERPLLAAGNSRGDKEMIEYSRRLHLIINPDEHVAPDQTESIAAYARRQGWLIEHMRDVTEAGFPAVSSKVYGIRENKPNP